MARAARGTGQPAPVLEPELSARDLSYVATAKARSSREVVAGLADALDTPLRESTALLLAAGYSVSVLWTGAGQPRGQDRVDERSQLASLSPIDYGSYRIVIPSWPVTVVEAASHNIHGSGLMRRTVRRLIVGRERVAPASLRYLRE